MSSKNNFAFSFAKFIFLKKIFVFFIKIFCIKKFCICICLFIEAISTLQFNASHSFFSLNCLSNSSKLYDDLS